MAEKDWLKKLLQQQAKARTASRSPYLPPVEGPRPKPVYGPPQKPPPWQDWRPPPPPKFQPPKPPPRSPYMPPVYGPRPKPVYGPPQKPPPFQDWQPPRPPQFQPPQQRQPDIYTPRPSGREAAQQWQNVWQPAPQRQAQGAKPPSEQYDLTQPVFPKFEPAKSGQAAARDWYKVYGKSPADVGEEPPEWSPLGQARKAFGEGMQREERGALPELPISLSNVQKAALTPLAMTPPGLMAMGALGGYTALQKGSQALKNVLPGLTKPEKFGLGLLKGSGAWSDTLTKLQSAYQTMGLASDPTGMAADSSIFAMGEAGPSPFGFPVTGAEYEGAFTQTPEQQELYQDAIANPSPENVYKFWDSQPETLKTVTEITSIAQQIMMPGPEVAMEHMPDVYRIATAMMSDPAAYSEVAALTRAGEATGKLAEKTGLLAHTKTSIAEKAAQWSSWYASRAMEGRIVEDVATGQKFVTPADVIDIVDELKKVDRGLESPEVRQVFSHFDVDNIPLYTKAVEFEEKLQAKELKGVTAGVKKAETAAKTAEKAAKNAENTMIDVQNAIDRATERSQTYEKELAKIQELIDATEDEAQLEKLELRLAKKDVQLKSAKDRIDKGERQLEKLKQTIEGAKTARGDVEAAQKIVQGIEENPAQAEIDLGALISQLNTEIMRSSYERAGLIKAGETLADANVGVVDKLNQYRKTVSTFFWLSSPRYVIRNVVNNYVTGYASGLHAFSKDAGMYELANSMFGLDDMSDLVRSGSQLAEYSGLNPGKFSRWMEYTPLGWGRAFARKATESERFYGEVGARRKLKSDAAMRLWRSLWSGDTTGASMFGVDSMFPDVRLAHEQFGEMEPILEGAVKDALRTATSWEDAERKVRGVLSGEYTPLISHLPEDTPFTIADIDKIETVFHEKGVSGLREMKNAVMEEAENANMIDLHPVNPDDFDLGNQSFVEAASRLVRRPVPQVDDEFIRFTSIYEDFWKSLAEYADKPGSHKVLPWVANKVMREKLLTYRRADELMARYRRLGSMFGSPAWDTYYEMELPALWAAENERHANLTQELLGQIDGWIMGGEIPGETKRYADDLVKEYTTFWKNLDMPRDADFEKFERQLMSNRTSRMRSQLDAWGDVQKALGEGNKKVLGHFNAANAEAERILGIAAAYVRRNRMDWLARGGKEFLREQMSLTWAKATRDVEGIYSDFRLSAAFDDVPDFARRASQSEIEKLVKGTDFEDVILDSYLDLGIGSPTNDKAKAAEEFTGWVNDYIEKHNRQIREELLGMKEAERQQALADAGYDTYSMGQISPELIPKDFPKYEIDPTLRGVTGNQRLAYIDPGGKEYVVQYEVIPESKLVTSHDAISFKENQNYNQELQERLRDAPVNKFLVDRIAKNVNPKEFTDPGRHLTVGQVVVGPNNEVLGGNGRIMALRRAEELYPQSNAGQKVFEQVMRDARMFGIDPAEVQAMRDAGENPVLVRRLVEDVGDLKKFAAELNEPPVAVMDSSAYIEKLSKAIDEDMITKLTRRGDTSSLYGMIQRSPDFVADLLAKVPQTEMSKYFDDDLRLTDEGLEKIRGAVFARAYSSSPWLIKNFVVKPPEQRLFKGIGRGLELAAPEMLRLSEDIRVGRTLPEYNISKDVAEALQKMVEYNRAKQTGEAVGSLSEWIARENLFGEATAEPLVQRIVQAFDKRKMDYRKVKQFLVDYADMVQEAKTGQLAMDTGEVLSRDFTPEMFVEAADRGIDLMEAPREGAGVTEFIERVKAARKGKEEYQEGLGLFGDMDLMAQSRQAADVESEANAAERAARAADAVEVGGVEEMAPVENLRAEPYTIDDITDEVVKAHGKKFVKPVVNIDDMDDDQIELAIKAMNDAKPDSMPEVTADQLRMAKQTAREGQWTPVRVMPNKMRDMLYQSGMQPHQMPDAQGPTVGAYTSEWSKRALADLDGLISKAEAGEISAPPVPPESVDAWVDAISGHYKQPFIEAKSMVAPMTKKLVDYALLDYGDRRYLDSVMELVFPYWFWPSRTAKNWMLRLIHHPGWFTAYSDLNYHLEQMADEDISVPHRYAGNIPVPFTDKRWWIGGAQEMIAPFANLLPDTDYNDPKAAWGNVMSPEEGDESSAANRTLQAIITTMNALGLGTYPGLDFAANEIMGKPTKGVRDVIPAVDVMASGSALLRQGIPELAKIIPPGGFGFTPVGSQWALYWTRRMIVNKAAQMLGVSDKRLETIEQVNQFLIDRGVDSEEEILPYRKLVEDLHRWENGDIENWELKMIVKGEKTPEFEALPEWQQQALLQEHEIYNDAAQSAGTDRALSVLSGYFMALRALPLRSSEQTVQAEKAAKAETSSRAEYKDFLNKAPEQVVNMNPQYDLYRSIGRRYDLQGTDTKYREQMDSLIKEEPGNFWKQADLRNQWYAERRKIFEKWEADQEKAKNQPELWSTYKATPEEVLAIRREQILDEVAKTRPRLYTYYENPEGATKEERGALDFDKYQADMDAWYDGIPNQMRENETIQRAITDAMNQGAMRDPLTARAWLESINDPEQVKQFIEQNELRITPLDALATVLKEQHYGRKDEREAAYVEEFGPDILDKKKKYDEAVEHLMETEWGITWDDVQNYYDAIRHVWNDDIWSKQNAYYDEIKRTYGDDIWDKQDQYFDYPKGGSARRQYLKQHPELLAYWKGKKQIIKKPEYAGLEEFQTLSKHFAKYYGVEEYLKWNRWLKDYYGVTEFKRRKRDIDKQFPGVVGGKAEDYIQAVYERFPWMKGVADDAMMRQIYSEVSAIPDSERIWEIKEAYDRDITLDELDAEKEIEEMIADMNLEKAKEEEAAEGASKSGSSRYGRSGYGRSRYSRYKRRYYPRRYYHGYSRYGGGGSSERVTYRPRVPSFVPGGTQRRERVFVK